MDRDNSEPVSSSRQLTASLARVNEVLRTSLLALVDESPARSTSVQDAEPKLDAFLNAVLVEAAQQVFAYSSALFIYAPEGNTLAMRHCVIEGEVLDTSTDPRLIAWRDPIPVIPVPSWNRMLETHCFIHLVNPESGVFWPSSAAWHLAIGHESVTCVPLFAGQRLLGLIGLGFRDCGGAAPERLEVSQVLAHQAALALELSRLNTSIRENEARLLLAHEAAGIGTWDWDLATGNVVWSPSNYELWCFDQPSEQNPLLPAEKVISAIYPDDQVRVRAELNDAVSQGKPFRSEFRILDTQGKVRWLAGLGRHVEPIRETGRSGRMIGVNLDVSERRAAEEARETRERAAQLADANDALMRSTARLITEPDLDAYLGAILVEAAQQAGAIGNALFLYDSATHALFMRMYALDGELLNIQTDDRLALWRTPAPIQDDQPWAELKKKHALIHSLDDETTPLWPASVAWHRGMGHEVVACVPLVVGERVLGFMGLGFACRDIAAERVELSQALAHQAVLALELTRLADEAQRFAHSAATAAERTRVASELHDGLQQLLLSSQLWAGVLRNEPGDGAIRAEALRNLDELLEAAVLEARRTVNALRLTRVNSCDELAASLEDLCRHTSTGQLRCGLETSGGTNDLPGDVQEQLYRIAQEAVSNAVKHSGASEIRLIQACEPDAIKLSIRDNGRGADLGQLLTARGFGLRSQRTRAESIGARIDYRTAPGEGFQVTVNVPLGDRG